MSDLFLSSDDYSEQAHNLYNEGNYDAALEVIREGLEHFPFAVDLHVGGAYARLARDEFLWARTGFETALDLDPDHEEALAGIGEALLKLGHREAAIRCFDRVLSLGFREDHDLMLQIGRALFREGMVDHARGFFRIGVDSHPDSSEAVACLGYALHRTGEEDAALYWFRRALDLDPAHAEARVYLGNLLYDRGEYEAALLHFERTEPGDHIDELAVWRLIELKKSAYNLAPTDPELAPWSNRLVGIADEMDSIDLLLAEVEAAQPDGSFRDPRQLELFGTLLIELQGMQRRGVGEQHRVKTTSGIAYSGTWDEIVLQMKMDDRELSEASVQQYMARASMRNRTDTGVVVPVMDAENFIRRAASAGVLTIIS